MAQLFHGAARGGLVLGHGSFGDLDLQARRRHVVFRQQLLDAHGKPALRQLPDREVHRHRIQADGAAFSQHAAGLLQHHPAQIIDEPGAFGDGDELGGGDVFATGLQANERLGRLEASGIAEVYRLIEHHEAVVVERVAHAAQHVLLAHVARGGFCIEAHDRVRLVLRQLHGIIQVAEDLLGAPVLPGKAQFGDAGGHVHDRLSQLPRAAHAVGDALESERVLLLGAAGEQQEELDVVVAVHVPALGL